MTTSVTQQLSQIPRILLGQFPSPVRRLDHISSLIHADVFEKDDGINSLNYAGNKVRKLEYLLAEDAARKASRIVTLGSAGSNHAVATSTYAKQLGKHCSVCLVDQPGSEKVQQNLLRHLALGTDLHWFENFAAANDFAHQQTQSDEAYLIPLGGSAALASIGFIQATFELSEQINKGLMPVPDRLYVACGTMGTAVGLLIGLALASLSTKLYAVRVTDRAVASLEQMENLTRATLAVLSNNHVTCDVALQDIMRRLHFCDNYFGEGYGIPTAQTLLAIEAGKPDHMSLDGTYTGKALSALMDHGKRGELDNQTVLFWNSLNRQVTPIANMSEHHRLGPHFARYFAD